MSPDTALFDVSRPGEFVSEDTQKSQMVCSRVTVHHREKPRAPFMSFPESVCARAAEVGGRGDTRLMASEAGGQPPTHPAKILQRLPRAGSARREAENGCGEEASPCQPGRARLPHPLSAPRLRAQPAGGPAPRFVSAAAAGRGTHPCVVRHALQEPRGSRGGGSPARTEPHFWKSVCPERWLPSL